MPADTDSTHIKNYKSVFFVIAETLGCKGTPFQTVEQARRFTNYENGVKTVDSFLGKNVSEPVEESYYALLYHPSFQHLCFENFAGRD